MSFLIYQKNNPEYLNTYLKYKRFIDFSAETTVDEAYFDLRTLFRFITIKDDINKQKNIEISAFRQIDIKNITLNDLDNITSNDIENYIKFLDYKLDNSPRTRNRKLASTKRFFEYLSNNNLITRNPTINCKSARTETRLPKNLTLEECKKMLAKIVNSNKHFKYRNYAITCIFINCSIRLSELVNIDLTDFKIDDSEQTLKVCGKGNKERLLYLNKAVCEAIKKYLEFRPNLGKDNKDYNALFISSRNKRISRRAVQHIIEDEFTMLFKEIRKDFHTHTLRHTSATLMYNENDIDIFVLKMILGHNCLAATEIYTQVSDKKLKYIMENCTISSILENEGVEFK